MSEEKKVKVNEEESKSKVNEEKENTKKKDNIAIEDEELEQVAGGKRPKRSHPSEFWTH